MLNAGKCPKCETTVSSVALEDVTVNVGFQPRWRGVSFCCPTCRAVLGVGIDPVALKADIVGEVVAALRGT